MPKKSSLTKRVNRLEKVSRPEVKFTLNESGAFDTVGSITGTLLKPQQLAEGAGRNQRIGDKVCSRNIRFQAIFKIRYISSSYCWLRRGGGPATTLPRSHYSQNR
jgi:hypothetical protein